MSKTPLGFLNPIGNLNFLKDNYLSKSSSCRKYFSPTGNIISIGLSNNPIGFLIFSVGKLFILWNLFSYKILIFKVNIPPDRWVTLETKVVIYSLDYGLSYGIYRFLWDFNLAGTKMPPWHSQYYTAQSCM